MWLSTFIGAAIIIANRAHYTIDVLIAIYIGIGVWYVFGYFWNERVVKPGIYMQSVIDPSRSLKRKTSIDLPIYDKLEAE